MTHVCSTAWKFGGHSPTDSIISAAPAERYVKFLWDALYQIVEQKRQGIGSNPKLKSEDWDSLQDLRMGGPSPSEGVSQAPEAHHRFSSSKAPKGLHLLHPLRDQMT